MNSFITSSVTIMLVCICLLVIFWTAGILYDIVLCKFLRRPSNDIHAKIEKIRLEMLISERKINERLEGMHLTSLATIKDLVGLAEKVNKLQKD